MRGGCYLQEEQLSPREGRLCPRQHSKSLAVRAALQPSAARLVALRNKPPESSRVLEEQEPRGRVGHLASQRLSLLTFRMSNLKQVLHIRIIWEFP